MKDLFEKWVTRPIKKLWDSIVEKVRLATRLLTFIILDLTNKLGKLLDKFMPIIITPINAILGFVGKIVSAIGSIFGIEGLGDGLKIPEWQNMSGRDAILRTGKAMLKNVILKSRNARWYY